MNRAFSAFVFVIYQMFAFVVEDVAYPLYSSWREIEEALKDDKIKDIINKYHWEYLKYSWRVFWNIAIFALWWNEVFTICFMTNENPQVNSAKIIIPLLLIIVISIKWITNRYTRACKHVFPWFVLCFGATCTFENTLF